MSDALLSGLTVLTAVAAPAVGAGTLHVIGRRRPGLDARVVDALTSLGISAVLSVVLGVVLTTVNVGIGSGFPDAFLTSVLLGVAVGTPTAYVVVPRVLRLTTPLGLRPQAAADVPSARP